MRDSSRKKLTSETKRSFVTALGLIRPHYLEIKTQWRKRLDKLGVGKDQIDLLFPLTLEAQDPHLQGKHFDAYLLELERHGQTLQSCGAVESRAVKAVACYFECCLPFVLGAGVKTNQPALAAARVMTLSEMAVLAGFARQRVVSMRLLQERERHNLSRDLHDEIGHNLLVLKLYLEMILMDTKAGKTGNLEAKLQEALSVVTHSIDSVRRMILNIGPGILSQLGFLPAVRQYARQFSLRTGIDVRVQEGDVPEELPSNYESALYRVLQGSLSNIVQHGHAKQAKVTIGTMKKTLLMMSIEDDGIGFDVASTLSKRAFGLSAMRERVESLGGKFYVESWPAGRGRARHGTRIELELPLCITGT